MESLYSFWRSFSGVRFRYDDDFVDRLHHVWTSLLLVMFTIAVSSKQYLGAPLHCWLGGTEIDGKQEYINNICWLSNTYWLPYNDVKSTLVPSDMELRKHAEIGYYQWVPIFLLVQAAMFYKPVDLWRWLTDWSGLNVASVTEVAVETSVTDVDGRAKTIASLAEFVDNSLIRLRERRERSRFWAITYRLSHLNCLPGSDGLTCYYFYTKATYLLNAICQIYLMNWFLSSDPVPIHLRAIAHSMWAGQNDWLVSGRFPRVTMCDFKIRVMGNLHPHTVQCVLPINMFNERIFAMLYIWFVALVNLTVLNGIYWALVQFIWPLRRRFVRSHLSSEIDRSEQRLFSDFVDRHLRMDGVLLLRLVAKNASRLIAVELCEALWQRYARGSRGQIDEKPFYRCLADAHRPDKRDMSRRSDDDSASPRRYDGSLSNGHLPPYKPVYSKPPAPLAPPRPNGVPPLSSPEYPNIDDVDGETLEKRLLDGPR